MTMDQLYVFAFPLCLLIFCWHHLCPANRAVEVTEMWRAREKELQLEAKLKERSKQYTGKLSSGEKPYSNSQHIPSSSRHKESMESLSYPPSKSDLDDCSNRDGLRDEELEEFLHARSATICHKYFNFRNCQIID